MTEVGHRPRSSGFVHAILHLLHKLRIYRDNVLHLRDETDNTLLSLSLLFIGLSPLRLCYRLILLPLCFSARVTGRISTV